MLEDGSEFAGYRIAELIGRGGMSEVYRAENPRLGNMVALKLLASQLAEDELFRERFVRESRLAAALDHPNVLPVYDAGEVDGRSYIAMRYVNGPDLKSLIEQGELPLERVVEIVRQVAGALDCAHGRGLLHRDVKPGNILIDNTGDGDHAYLADFGVAKHSQSSSGLTRTGQFVGTIDYISPEQIEGKSLDGRTDVYSLGCVAYEALAGSSPFERDSNVAMIYAHLLEPPPSILDKRPDLPPILDDVIGKALAKSPEDRYPSCRAFVADLRAAAGSAGREPTTSTPSAATGTETVLSATTPAVASVPAAAAPRAAGGTVDSPTAPPPPLRSGGSVQPPPPSVPPVFAQTPDRPSGPWRPSRRLAVAFVVLLVALTGAVTAAKTLSGDSAGPLPAPTALHGSPKPSSVMLSWQTPISGAVDGYRVFRDGRQVAVTRRTAYVDRKLSPSTRYVYAVRAYHGGEVGRTSNRVAVRTLEPGGSGGVLGDVPFAPTDVRATAGNASAKVRWTAPADNGGKRISSYIVTSYAGAVAERSTKVRDGTLTTIRRLANGTRYSFTVTAVNAVGMGTESAPSHAVTPHSPPPRPTTTQTSTLRHTLPTHTLPTQTLPTHTLPATTNIYTLPPPCDPHTRKCP
jgi:serine/threonine protein kinase